MSDQQIENIVDGIVDIVLTDLDISAQHDRDEDGHHTWYDADISTRQRDKLIDVFERLLT